MSWDCPACGRRFGHRNQSHTCAPAITPGERLDRLPSAHRAICEAVLLEFAGLADVVLEPVEVGFFLKRSRSFAQMRPMKSRVRLIMRLGRAIEHERVSQPYPAHGRYVANVVDLYQLEDVDDDLRAWLAESYADAGP
jgi:hypothetical protein